ncbi:MAG: DUF3772 domain-containing protein [Hyphomonas sp.]|nr:DUF3772 domain-containing protein [Hyphomonas sp.]
MRLILSITCLLVCLAPAFAQNSQLVDDVGTRREALQMIAAEIASNPELDHLATRETLRSLRSEGIAAARPLREQLDDLQADLDRLGPMPEPGVRESEDLARTRAQLVSELSIVGDAVRQSDVNIAQASRLLEDIANLRRVAFYADTFARGPSPLAPSQWRHALQSFDEGRSKLRALNEAPKDESADVENAPNADLRLWMMFAAIAIAIGLFWPVRRWTDRKVIDHLERLGVTQSTRTAIAGARTAARIVPGILGGYIMLETARAQGFVDGPLQPVMTALWFGLIAIFVVDGVATAIFAPRARDWRLVPVRSRAAVAIRLILWAATTLFVVDIALNAGATALGASTELTRIQSSMLAIIGAGLLFLLCRKKRWILQEDHQEFAKDSRGTWRLLGQAGQFIAILIILSTLLGYVALARYAITRIFFVIAVLGVAWFARALAQEGVKGLRHRAVKRAKADELIEEHEEHLIYFWIGLIVDVALIALATPVLLVVLGFEVSEVRDWIWDAFFGFQIGAVTISIAQILSALLTFALILLGTRFIQRGADRRVFARATLDDGVRNSFKTLIGYVGLTIAAVSAIAMLGLKLSNLAIIAGALSVGIGFGLQSIVNNFVSGLILLFERPIKVGDWIIVSSGEGIVKRISVRSTEIETFDRSSIIVPNSELIASSVTNWTHKDKFSRIILPIGVAYKENPRRVMALLDKVMRANNRVSRFPEPMVFFAGFGDSSLDFEMRVFIRTPDDRILVQNELRVSAFEAFRDADIEIPFPQRDVHFKPAPDQNETPSLTDVPC